MSALTVPSAVVELRRYTLHPGRRDELIELFEAQFVDTQRAVGIDVIGRFSDDDHPDTFTWFRGFPDMVARRASLAAFYGGPCWAQHRDAANATMIDSDDVLLLTPVAGHGFNRTVDLLSDAWGERFDVVTFHLDAVPSNDLVLRVCTSVGPADAVLVTLDEANDFPALPVREGEHVVVVVARPRAAVTWEQLGTAAFGQALSRTEVFHLRSTARS